ncbi:MAG TPA: SigE family RNA polymerase sigma factor [Actinomycetota bacterium]|nr:SigE family RNA polymerase sigma factor [Actinomycetota bacterium]
MQATSSTCRPFGAGTRLMAGRRTREEAVAELFDRHYAPMCRLAYAILGDAALAEEIVMESLLKTFTGWGRLRDVERVDAYLRRAVVNLCRSKIRRKVIEARVNSAIHHRDERKAPDWDPERHETGRLVWAAVVGLPERQRACVVLRYFEDLPEAQIAEVLDCSVGTVKSQLSKARTKLEPVLRADLEDRR